MPPRSKLFCCVWNTLSLLLVESVSFELKKFMPSHTHQKMDSVIEKKCYSRRCSSGVWSPSGDKKNSLSHLAWWLTIQLQIALKTVDMENFHHLFVFLCCVEGFRAKQLNSECLNLSVIKMSSFRVNALILRFPLHVVFTKSLLNSCSSWNIHEKSY